MIKKRGIADDSIDLDDGTTGAVANFSVTLMKGISTIYSFELSQKGYAGKPEGASGSLQVKFEF
jgi:hypothetical protein